MIPKVSNLRILTIRCISCLARNGWAICCTAMRDNLVSAGNSWSSSKHSLDIGFKDLLTARSAKCKYMAALVSPCSTMFEIQVSSHLWCYTRLEDTFVVGVLFSWWQPARVFLILETSKLFGKNQSNVPSDCVRKLAAGCRVPTAETEEQTIWLLHHAEYRSMMACN